jgi:hypothetical protein
MIWDTPMLAMNGYNYTKGFKGIDFLAAAFLLTMEKKSS